MTISHETLLAEIMNIQRDTKEIKENYKEVCKQVNTNRENIASHKSTLRIVEGFIVSIFIAIVGLFIGKYK